MHNDVIYKICDNTQILYVVHEDVVAENTIIPETVIEELKVVYTTTCKLNFPLKTGKSPFVFTWI